MSPEEKLKRILKLFLVFLRIGAFTFGGGYAMIPFIQKEVVENNKWIKEEDIVDIFAVVQSVPGVIAVNSSIFVGYRVAGLAGAFASTLGVVLPSFVVISVIAVHFYNFKDIPVIAHAFDGIRAGVVALMVFSIQKLAKPSIKDIYGLIVAVAAFISITAFNINAVYVLLSAAFLGLIIKYIKKRAEA